MKNGITVRGSRKIYQLLDVSVPHGGRIEAHSTSFDGRELPATVAAKTSDKDQFVLIVADFPFGQTVRVSVFDKAGELVGETKRTFHHTSAALISKFHTVSKSRHAGEIRNIDHGFRFDLVNIEVDYQMRFGYEPEEKELVHVRAKLVCNHDFDVEELAFSLFDTEGTEREISDYHVLSDTHKNLDDGVSGSEIRCVECSFRKPIDCEEYYLWIRPHDCKFPGGLLFADAAYVANARARFEPMFLKTSQCDCYEPWFMSTQRCSPLELEAQRLRRFDIEPTFSVIVPLYRTPIAFFEEMASSVLSQTYSRIELVLVNASPEDAGLAAAVERLRASDGRVRVVELAENMGIALNTNEGIRAASGDFLSFFDHDDVLEPNLFYEYVDAINRYPETDLLYCDEDKIRDGHYCDGHLKSDFSWELLATCNYVCHLLTVRRSTVEGIELSGDDVAGAQDWDMTLKVAERARNIFHVRRVLYHWRKHDLSAAANPDAKPYTGHAGEIALKHHFKRVGIKAELAESFMGANVHRVVYKAGEQKPLVSVVIPIIVDNGNLERCLKSVCSNTANSNVECILVCSRIMHQNIEQCAKQLDGSGIDCRIVACDDNAGIMSMRNIGAASAKGDYVLFLNEEVEVMHDDWLNTMLGPFQRAKVAVAGARLLYPDDTIHHIGIVIPRSAPKLVCHRAPDSLVFYHGVLQDAREVCAVSAACMMVERNAFEAVDGFNESFETELGDVEFCLRLRDALKRDVLIEPHASLYRHIAALDAADVLGNVDEALANKEAALLQKGWPHFFNEGDPFYSVHVREGGAYYELPSKGYGVGDE